MPPQYKFVELTPVTDETLENCVNEWVGKGWAFDGVRFVTTDHSKRPGMAFVSFVRELGSGSPAPDEGRGEAPRVPPPLVKPTPGGEPDALTGDDDAPNVLTAKHGDDVD
jgi:hypothetical protein